MGPPQAGDDPDYEPRGEPDHDDRGVGSRRPGVADHDDRDRDGGEHAETRGQRVEAQGRRTRWPSRRRLAIRPSIVFVAVHRSSEIVDGVDWPGAWICRV